MLASSGAGGVSPLGASDGRLDAALCVLAGADVLRGRCVAPAEAQREAAEAEEWIWFAGGDAG